LDHIQKQKSELVENVNQRKTWMHLMTSQ